VPFRSDFQNADRDQALVMTEECGTGWFDYVFIYHVDDPIDAKYRLPTDALPRKREGHVENVFEPYLTVGVVPELLQPDILDDKTFSAVLDKSTSDLSEIAKARVALGLDPLRPSARTKLEDDAEKAFWTDWARKSVPEEGHEKALAARLESIACVAEGAPYVARGLLGARRFYHPYASKEANEQQSRSFDRLKNARGGGDPACLGAVGLVEGDFGQPAP
jgi:hypothetical protein